MYIQNRKDYLITENLKQAREYLLGKDIPIDTQPFLYIVDKLEKMPNLIYTFTRMVFKNGQHIDHNITDEFDRISTWIINNRNLLKELPKNITQYIDLEELSDDITELDISKKVNTFYKSLYKSMRDEVDRLDKSDKNRFNDIASAFMDLTDDYKKMFTPIKYFQMNNSSIHEFMDVVENFINGNDLNQEKKKIHKYIEKHSDKINITYNNDNILVIQTNDRDAVCDLGADKWCIVYSPDSYQPRYMGEHTKNTQYIIFNFNLPTSNRYSMFGVTMDIRGIPISGGSQDKLNNNVPINEIYERTGIPKGILVSKYKDVYDKLMIKLSKIENGTIDELITLREELTSIGLGSLAAQMVDSYVNRYIDNLPLNNQKDKYEKSIADIIDICEDKLSISHSKYTKAFSITYINNIANNIDIKNISNIDDIITKFHEALTSVDGLIRGIIKLSEHMNEWILLNATTDGKYNIKMIQKIMNEVPSLNYEMSYIDPRFNILITSIIDLICTSKNTFIFYSIEMGDILSIFDMPFSYIYDHIKWNYTLSDIVFILYVYTIGIGKLNTLLQGSYNRNDMHLYSYVDFDMNGTKEITEYINNYQNIMVAILDIGFYNVSEYTLNALMLEGIIELIESYADSSKMTFQGMYYLLKNNIDLFSENDEIFTYFIQPISEWYGLNDVDEKELLNYTLLLIEHNIDILELISVDNISYDSIENSYIEFVGRVIKESGESKITTDAIVSQSPLLAYAISIHDSSYNDMFYKMIGLKYHENSKRWYMNTSYDELSEYLENKIDLENIDDYYHDVDSGAEISDIIEFIDLDILSKLAHGFQSDDVDIDTTALDKYYTEENVTQHGTLKFNYKETRDIYKSDINIKKLYDRVVEIIDEEEYGDTGGIVNAFLRAFNYAYSNEFVNEVLGNVISEIGDAFLEEWPDTEKSYGRSYLVSDTESKLMVIPNMEVLWDRVSDFGDMLYDLSNMSGIEEFHIEDIIELYIHYNGKIYFSSDDIYISYNEIDMEYFNEELSNQLEWEVNFDYSRKINNINENINSILGLSEYLKIIYK